MKNLLFGILFFGAIYSQAATVSKVTPLSVSVADGQGIQSVSFFVDGTLICTDTTSPYSCLWDTTKVSNGSHTITATAKDLTRNVSPPDSKTVNVFNSEPPPPPPCVPKGRSGKNCH